MHYAHGYVDLGIEPADSPIMRVPVSDVSFAGDLAVNWSRSAKLCRLSLRSRDLSIRNLNRWFAFTSFILSIPFYGSQTSYCIDSLVG